ncbi:hypothetical protein JCM3765_003207 [Sporobolomyces pararoseus]
MSLENDSAMNDYDPWMDEDEAAASTATAGASSSTQISEQEWDKLSSRFSDAGYRDGITAGKNSKLQTGFDQGFAIAAPFARELGSLRGIAASLLSLLTTASGAKHASTLLESLEQSSVGGSVSKDSLVTELREIVNALGKLDANKILPIDKEAEEHAKSHEDEGISQHMKDRKEMREMEDMLSGIGGKATPSSGVEECRKRLEGVLAVFGMEEILPPPQRS